MNHLFLRKMYVRRGSVDHSVDIDAFLFGGFSWIFVVFFSSKLLGRKHRSVSSGS